MIPAKDSWLCMECGHFEAVAPGSVPVVPTEAKVSVDAVTPKVTHTVDHKRQKPEGKTLTPTPVSTPESPAPEPVVPKPASAAVIAQDVPVPELKKVTPVTHPRQMDTRLVVSSITLTLSLIALAGEVYAYLNGIDIVSILLGK